MRHHTPSLLSIVALAAACQAATAAPETYSIDWTHTKAIWEAKHFGTSTNRGSWDKTEGTVTYDKTSKTGSATVVIDMGSVNTGVPAFNAHLKGPDFFNTQLYPKATFVGESFKFSGDQLVEVVGKLTLLGKTNPITLKAKSFGCYQNPMLKREVCGGDFETVVKRSMYGMNWGLANKVTDDDIKLTLQVEAIKK
jgi:polyisoprenoid-binding protein YceI